MSIVFACSCVWDDLGVVFTEACSSRAHVFCSSPFTDGEGIYLKRGGGYTWGVVEEHQGVHFVDLLCQARALCEHKAETHVVLRCDL